MPNRITKNIGRVVVIGGKRFIVGEMMTKKSSKKSVKKSSKKSKHVYQALDGCSLS